MDDAGMTGRASRHGRFALLLVLLAALAGCGSDDAPEAQSPPAAGEHSVGMADAGTIRKRIIGNTVTGTMTPESAYTEYYAPNGDIRGASYEARWSIKGDEICLNYDEALQIDCYGVKIDGQSVEWHRQDEVQGTGTIVEGNPNNF